MDLTTITNEQIDAALADESPDNEIAIELARLIDTYTQNFAAHCEKVGRVPTELMLKKPDSEIERVAMRLTSQAISDELGEPLKLVWV
tara:strand:- start:2491 stop:2754 length:264 start_codon:yes stop_codon:yes gene_type:complete